jgi:hypothetical protein
VGFTDPGSITCWDGSVVTPSVGGVCSTPSDCTGTPWGTIAHGASVTAYQNSVVPFGSSCISQSRSCWNGSLSGSYTITSCSVTPPANCVGTPWGTVTHNTSVTGYSASTVNDPTTCSSVSETRNCWNGTLSGSNTITSCVVKSGSITVPSSCVIAALASSCSVTVDWTSANLDSPRLYDSNTGSTVSTSANGSQSVSIPWGGSVFVLTDSSSHTYDTKSVSVSCTAGTTWNSSTGRCEYDTTASISTNPVKVSYNDDSTITWSTSYATACTTSGNWTNSGVFNGSKSTGALTSNQTYTLQCTGLGAPSPTVSASVDVCPSSSPVLNKDGSTCQAKPTINVTFSGQYTPNGRLVITSTNADACSVSRNGTTLVTGGTSMTFRMSDYGTQQGTYVATCRYTDANGTVFNAVNPFSIWYQPVPPPPVVSLKASPSTITAGAQSVLTWTITYPGSVQVPSRVCRLKATPVCANGSCTASQLLASTTVNTIIQASSTDTNDPVGSRRITNTALNEVPGYDMVANDGDTDWKGSGKKTFILNKSMDFKVNCGNGANESAGVRVLVTNSVEG